MDITQAIDATIQRLQYIPPQISSLVAVNTIAGGGINILESQGGGGDLAS